MKNPALSVWLSAANRAAGWWIGTATSIARRQQQLTVAELTRAVTAKKAARKRKATPGRRT